MSKSDALRLPEYLRHILEAIERIHLDDEVLEAFRLQAAEQGKGYQTLINEALPLRPQEVWVDGLYCPDTGLPSRAIVQGDNSVASISAASILAKTARDAAMLELHEQYPQYGFAAHKGYPTAAHLAALKLHGVSVEHRRSFRPVRELLFPLPQAGAPKAGNPLSGKPKIRHTSNVREAGE